MSTVGSQARIATPPSVKPPSGEPGQYPDLSAGGMAYTGWLVWQAARDKCGAGGLATERQGVSGHLWEGTVWSILRDLWPLVGKDDPNIRSLYPYLRSTRNMVCVQRRRDRSVWWVADSWQQPRGSVRSLTRYGPARAAAGEAAPETRSGPVTVTFQCRVCGQGGFRTRPARGAHEGHHGRDARPGVRAAVRPVAALEPARAPEGTPARDAASEAVSDAAGKVQAALAEIGEAFRDVLTENSQLRQQLDQVRKALG